MQSLFNQSDNQEIINRINRLTPATQGLWGKMNVTQMLTHSSEPLRMALGELELKANLLTFFFSKILRRKFTKDTTPFSKNLPTSKQLVIVDTKDFEQEKERLILLVKQFITVGTSGITTKPHPVFGKMTPQEWDIIQWKHLDHHLRQFGV